MFIDTNGEMSFVDNERLKFIMHYLKQGADDSLVEMKDGRFVREDSELSFTEIWLPAAEHQQREIDKQQEKVEELQEEFAEDERFLKEQIKDKDLKISNLEYQQGMDKELIQSLQSKSEKLQKRVDAVEQVITKIRNGNYASDQGKYVAIFIGQMLEQALKGEE